MTCDCHAGKGDHPRKNGQASYAHTKVKVTHLAGSDTASATSEYAMANKTLVPPPTIWRAGATMINRTGIAGQERRVITTQSVDMMVPVDERTRTKRRPILPGSH
jgi:hypothetical protein